jgi:hypothetical protein
MADQDLDEIDYGDQDDQQGDRTRKLSASYRSQTGHLTRVISKAEALVVEAATGIPSKTMFRELEKSLTEIRGQQEKCANTCEEILESQEHTDANVKKIEGCLDRDAKQGNLVVVRVTRELVRCEIGLMPPAPPVAGPGPNVGQVRVVCKPEKDLKPQELTADMTPVEFAYWVDAFGAYHSGSHMEMATIAVQQAFFKACVHSILYNRIKSYIISGVTPVIGPGDTIMGLMRDEFLLEHSLFARRLAYFRFKQAKGQAMSDAVNELQRLGDQSCLAGLTPDDLCVMRYLTITDDPELLDKLLEIDVPFEVAQRCY